MQTLSIAYSTFKSLVTAAVKVYYNQDADGVYSLIMTTDHHLLRSQAKGADAVDFEATLKASSLEALSDEDAIALSFYGLNGNPVVTVKARDGRPTVRTSTANRTTNFKLRVFSFITATGSSSIHNVNPVTDDSYGDVTLTMYDAEGEVTVDPALAVVEHLDLMPAYNYEIIGGYMDVPTALKNGTTNQWYLSVIGVPDLPPEAYGSVDFISEVNLEAVMTDRVTSDGRAISYLPYNYGGYPTNKLRFIIKHPAGVAQRLQIYVEHFV